MNDCVRMNLAKILGVSYLHTTALFLVRGRRIYILNNVSVE